ncbi:uncharacterized protein LOC131649153 [Vicia villosa]|uniref:uncharacterized protein LOC131649153 n=1 Tax=Vicia villosa TaxID=3911 RepID=UPI00273AF766|nr:uncharacterized protein LOC131649153 [Vicia villosa]
MIIGSFNIRGVCSFIKRRRIHQIISNGKADVFLIQETKLKSCTDSTAKSFWRDVGIDYSVSDSVGGDFNSVKNGGERKCMSVVGNQVEWDEFTGFINAIGLEDVPCKGKKFRWLSSDGRSKSRIDRFLVSRKIINWWGVVGQQIGDRDISDHCPIWIVADKMDWGPKPFKFNNEWFQYKEFIGFVEKEWNGLDLEEGVKEINAIDNHPLDEEVESGDRWRANRKFWMNLKIRENMLIQKARLKWLNDGDDNSRYFHAIMKRGLRRNFLGHISTSRGILSKVEEVKEEIFEHFESKFKESEVSRPVLDGDIFNKLSIEDKNSLELPFEESEIK